MRQSINQQFAGMFPKFRPVFGDEMCILISKKYGEMMKLGEGSDTPRVRKEIETIKKQLIHLLEEYFKIHKIK